MKRFLSAFLLTLSLAAQAGLPPTSSKISGESVYSTTFKTDFGTFKGTRSGTTLTLNSIGAGAGDSLVLGGTKAASAVLDVQSTTQGVLPPRMTTAQMNAIPSPANGLTIYNTDVNSLASWNGTTWTYGFGSITPSTNMSAYTPVFTGTTGLSGVDVKWERQGDMLKVIGTFSVSSATAMTISLPPGFTVDANKISASNYQTIGSGSVSSAFALSVTVLAQGGSSGVSLGLHFSGSSGNIPYTAWGPERFQFNFEVPIAGWTSNTSAWVQANSNPIATTTEFVAEVSATGVISGTNANWLSSCINSNPTICTYVTGLNTLPMVCSANTSDPTYRYVIYNTSSTATQVITGGISSTTNTPEKSSFTLKCTLQGADYTAAHSPFIIGIQQSVNMYSATPTPTTSGTSIDFNSIPAGVKKVTISFNGVSTNSTSPILIQLGTGGSVVTSSYVSGMGYRSGETVSTSGLLWSLNANASSGTSGAMTLNLSGSSTGLWTVSGVGARDLDGFAYSSGGYKTLTTALDRIRITTVSGTDTFDAGNVNVSWEY